MHDETQNSRIFRSYLMTNNNNNKFTNYNRMRIGVGFEMHTHFRFVSALWSRNANSMASNSGIAFVVAFVGVC